MCRIVDDLVPDEPKPTPSFFTVGVRVEDMQTGIQLYTLRELDASLPEQLSAVGETSLDGVEFAGVPSGDGLQEALAATGLTMAGAHVQAEEIEHDPEAVADACRALDCVTVIVPYLDESHFVDREAVIETAERLETLAELLDEHDCRLLYHNHDHEFVTPTDTDAATAFDLLVEETDESVGFELDLGWAEAAGQDPVDLLDQYSDRIPLVHLKDVTADGEPTDLGDGVLDIPGCVDAAREAGVEWVLFEHDHPEDPLASLATADAVLQDPHRAR
ncbi:Sugar phosphate isomerase/epimerase [Natranaeroarchaeum sulfidigenes]|uniref:Sugar phosphate isomerase/epimerase n=1 Tax=Natranaeroarchaeum sulfidigenes TaxID=2784880 RepID=A0A897MUD6_9EURY|nr:Sugar phosphate isomerase/epimerase [Natranaeroarchaeum sulfidigenes]